MNKTRLAIAGATGNVGREIIRIMEERQLFVTSPVLLGSSVSEGENIPYEEADLQVQSLKDYDFKNIDAIIFATPKEVSELYIPKAQQANVKVVDLSAHLRTAENTHLYFDGLSTDVSERTDTVAIPTTASIQLAKALTALSQSGLTLKHVDTTTMCPVSMAGADSMEELFAQSAALLGGAGAEETTPETFSAQIAYNIIPQVGDFKGKHTDGELALMLETNRALTVPVSITTTTVYVPTFIGVSQTVTVDVDGAIEADKMKDIFEKVQGVAVIDKPEEKQYSTPFGTAETDAVYVSRIREDMLGKGKLQFWLAGDNVRLAALSALNAVQKMF